MNHEHAPIAGRVSELVHHRGQLNDAPRGATAPMVVPHVANDERRLARIPQDQLLDCARLTLGVPIFRQGAAAGVELHGSPRIPAAPVRRKRAANVNPAVIAIARTIIERCMREGLAENLGTCRTNLWLFQNSSPLRGEVG